MIKLRRVTETTFLKKGNTLYVFYKDHYFAKPLIYAEIHDTKLKSIEMFFFLKAQANLSFEGCSSYHSSQE